MPALATLTTSPHRYLHHLPSWISHLSHSIPTSHNDARLTMRVHNDALQR